MYIYYYLHAVNESNRQTVDQNGNLREDDCEEDIGPHFGKHYICFVVNFFHLNIKSK